MSRPFPRRIGAVEVPQDAISRAAWIRAERSLPEYLFSHSVRSYCWGIALAAHDGLELDREIFWVAALLHDVGLTRIGRSGE
ncbi:MAG TPA: HD domain-containing protein, partial [Candidatus Limnocylindrales bacterium]